MSNRTGTSAVVGVVLTLYLIALGFWAAVAYVAYHFISKNW